MTLEVGVKAFIKNSKGKYLVLLRSVSYDGENFTRWDLPGGRIEIGEKLEDALNREIKEETGLSVSKILRLLSAQDLLRNPKKHTVRITYIVECNKETVILNPSEHSEYKWVTVEELQQLKHDVYLTPLLDLV